MLCCLCTENPTEWDTALPIVEFHYNNSVNSSTKMSPFYVSNGYHPRFNLSHTTLVEAAGTELGSL